MTEASAEKQSEENPERDDSELIKQARDDRAAFAVLYRLYLDRVYRYFVSRVGNGKTAEDLTAEVFLQAFEGLPEYQHRGHFSAWLFTIARRRLVDHYRGRSPEKVKEIHDLPEDGVSPLEQLVHDQELESLREAVSTLANEKQELLRLRFAAGLTFSEIAKVQGRSESAVKMAYYRLLDRLEMKLKLEGMHG
ncbi:MAG: sigma-70 family RNA polymerase sigma factor [Anaerolineales bacterium]